MQARAGRGKRWGKRRLVAGSSQRGLEAEIQALPRPLGAQGEAASGKAKNGGTMHRPVGKLLLGW